MLRSRDAKTQRLMQQIALIENELLTISSVEIDRHRAKSEQETKLLAEKRQALVQLLGQLCGERDKRMEQLKRRLVSLRAAVVLWWWCGLGLGARLGREGACLNGLGVGACN